MLTRTDFQVRRPGRAFFKQGKVFKTLWPEPAGTDANGTVFLPDTAIKGKFNEYFYVKVRWFVVIKEGHHECVCL